MLLSNWLYYKAASCPFHDISITPTLGECEALKDFLDHLSTSWAGNGGAGPVGRRLLAVLSTCWGWLLRANGRSPPCTICRRGLFSGGLRPHKPAGALPKWQSPHLIVSDSNGLPVPVSLTYPYSQASPRRGVRRHSFKRR